MFLVEIEVHHFPLPFLPPAPPNFLSSNPSYAPLKLMASFSLIMFVIYKYIETGLAGYVFVVCVYMVSRLTSALDSQ